MVWGLDVSKVLKMWYLADGLLEAGGATKIYSLVDASHHEKALE